jgi:hypothetical protein
LIENLFQNQKRGNTMPVDLNAFILGRKLAQEKGLNKQKSNKVGVLTGLMGVNPSSIAFAKKMAEEEAEPAAAAQPEQPPVKKAMPVSPELEYLKKLDRKIDLLLERTEKLMAKQTPTDTKDGQDETTGTKPSYTRKPSKK